jgi:hypothetical protein
MKSLFRRLFRAAPARSQTRPACHFRPDVESLEGRALMTVTPHGGAVLPNVEVQALYYGSNWYNNSSLFSQTGQFEGFLQSTVNSSYMDMLNNAGYGVGRGSSSGGKISMATPGSTISDADIRSAIQNAIRGSNPLAAPDANRLYIVYVEPNVEVIGNFASAWHSGLANSVQDFAGYHGAFAGYDAAGNARGIRYAVIPTPGGTVGNAKNNYNLNTFDEMTEASSHEIGEAVTDPDIGYGTLGWYDDSQGEVGDIANGQTVYVNGYAVQRLADKTDQPMTPAQATSDRAAHFVLQTNGTLYEVVNGSATYLTSGVASLSAQGIDNNGHATTDIVMSNGAAWEYHDETGWAYLTGGVKMARAGQGVSYVLLTSGDVWEYKDTGSWSKIDSNVTSIDAGTDRHGANMMTEVMHGYGYEWSDSSGWHSLGSGITSVSAGRQGGLDYVTTNGNAYYYTEASGSASLLAYNVAQVTAGTDQNGNFMIDLLYTNGNLYEYRVNSGWTFLDNGVTSVGKAEAGAVDMVFSWGDAWDHSPSGWAYLLGSAQAVA